MASQESPAPLARGHRLCLSICSSNSSTLPIRQRLRPPPDPIAGVANPPASGLSPPTPASASATATAAVHVPAVTCRSDLGHPANRRRDYPLPLVPFDVEHSYELNEACIIKPYDVPTAEGCIGQSWLGSYMNDEIWDEGYFQHFVMAYLDSFYYRPEGTFEPTTFRASVIPNYRYYLQTGEYKYLPEVKKAKEAAIERRMERERMEEPDSDTISVILQDIRGTKPDAGLAKHHPQGSKKVALYFLTKLKRAPLIEVGDDEAEKRRLHVIALQHAHLEAIIQTIYYANRRQSLQMSHGDGMGQRATYAYGQHDFEAMNVLLALAAKQGWAASIEIE
ncbi:hypothetical protein IAR50_000823 [Cryptococcus sp. DSM 104548]